MTDLEKLNTATKYPSIPTYHTMDRGVLQDNVLDFSKSRVVLTEKVNGTNGRIVLMPDGDWFIGEREGLLTAKGDRVHNTSQSIVEVLKPVAERLKGNVHCVRGKLIQVFFFEVYGHKIGPGAAKNYTCAEGRGCRLFDIRYLPVEVLDSSREEIAAWRDAPANQVWASEATLNRVAEAEGVELVPRLGTMDSDDLPGAGPDGIRDMRALLEQYTPVTLVALDGDGGESEGIVLRTTDREIIAKARFEDYIKTFRKRGL